MEEENLFLIQNNQDIEQQLEELRLEYKATLSSMERQTKNLEDGKRTLQDKIDAEQRKADALHARMRTSSSTDAQESLMKKLGDRISEVYARCGGDLTSNPDRIAMLTKLEGKLEELLAKMSRMPED